MFNVRLGRIEDIERLKYIWSVCFYSDPKEYTDWFFANKFAPEKAVVVEHDGQIIACGYLVDYKLVFDGHVLDSPYIVGVATLPQYRKQGHAARIMHQLLRMAEESGAPLCILNPFKHEFYEKFGFITYTFLKDIKPKTGLQIKTMPFSAEELLRQYNTFARQFNSYVYRDGFYLERLLQEHFCDEGTVDLTDAGYCLRHDDTVDELVSLYDNEEELLGALGMARAHKHTDAACAFELGNMVRIINLRAFLRSCSFNKDLQADIALYVKDEICPRNNGIFRLVINNSRASLESIEASPALTVDISELTAFLFGIKPLEKDPADLNRFFVPMVHLGFEKY